MAEEKDRKKGSRKMTFVRDSTEQLIEEKMPGVVRAVIKLLPKSVLEGGEDALWTKALPYLSIALGQLVPEGKSWSTIADTIRSRFFAELKRQLSASGEEETGEVVKQDGGVPKKVPAKEGFLSLEKTEIESLLSWAETQDEKERHEIWKFFRHLPLSELKALVALDDSEKTKFYKLQRAEHHFSHALSEKAREDFGKLDEEAATSIDKLTEKVNAWANGIGKKKGKE